MATGSHPWISLGLPQTPSPRRRLLVPAWSQYPQRKGSCLIGRSICLNAVALTAQIHGSGCQGMPDVLLTIAPKPMCTMFESHPHNFELCWFRGLGSRGKNASIRGDSSRSNKVDGETVIWPFWAPHATEPTDKKVDYCICWGDWSQLPRGHWATAVLHSVAGRPWLEPRAFSAALLSASMSNSKSSNNNNNSKR